MKKKEWNEGLDHLDPELVIKYVEQKDQLIKQNQKKVGWLRFGVVAACLCLMIGATTVAALVPKEEQTSESETTADAPATSYAKGLSYKVNSDGETCTVTGIGTCDAKYVHIPSQIDGYQVTAIEVAAFARSVNMEGITIPEGVTRIGSKAFESCSKLQYVSFPNTLIDVGSDLFKGCPNIFYTTYKNVNYLGNETNSYHFLVGVTDGTTDSEIEIHESTVVIGPGAFQNYKNLSKVTIPPKVAWIGESAFQNCSKLTNITFSDSVEIIGNLAFSGTRLTEVNLGNGVVTIADGAFYDCEQLTEVVIGDGVKRIGKSAFSDCKVLESVHLGKNVSEIREDAFRGCPQLSSISVDSENKTYCAVQNCLIEKTGKILLMGSKNSVIPTDETLVTSIANSAFLDFEEWQSVVIIPKNINQIAPQAFSPVSVLYYEGIDGSFDISNLYVYSETQPETTGKFWHYVNGVPVVWQESQRQQVDSSFDNDGDGKKDSFTFSKVLPEEFESPSVILLEGKDHLATDVGVKSSSYVDGPDFYFVSWKGQGDASSMYISWKVEIPEDGMYDFCFLLHVREKQQRSNCMYIDGEEIYKMDYQINDGAFALDERELSYMSGMSAYLTKGEHIIKMEVHPDIPMAFQFCRIYLAKAS
ncbi:MAG: hypothetical protein E7629_02205 [Ruminococcaceae bacterium]|nr:hypothetical protein [Oscillospiraceae bacterium]